MANDTISEAVPPAAAPAAAAPADALAPQRIPLTPTTSGGVQLENAAALLVGVVAGVLFLIAVRAVRRRMQCGTRCCFSSCCSADEASLLPTGSTRSDAAGAMAGGSASAPRGVAREQWSLEGCVAVVTGGSKGIGRAIVEELLEQGCEVITCARDVRQLDELLDHPACTVVAADVSTAAGRASLIGALSRRHGSQLDILVNNVGTNLRKPSVEYTEEEYELLCATNQGAAFHLSRALHPALRARRGCVVNVSSVCGSTSDATGAVYHMNKAALEHMTRYLACEWGPHGVRVNAVAPWFVRTPLTAPLLSDGRFHDAVRRATPLRRVGEPFEVAAVVAFLCMPAAGYVSGQVVGIDGAMMQEGFRYDARVAASSRSAKELV